MSEFFQQGRKNKTAETLLLAFVVFFASFSVAAWWDWNKGKEKKKEAVFPAAAKRSFPSEKASLKEDAPQKPEPEPLQKSKTETKEQVADQTERQRQEVAKIQTELKEVIGRTRRLQNQVKDNRTEIQRMLERAQIHEQILKSITVPDPIRTKQQIDATEIVRREKLRLIAEQAHKTQAQLRTIQQTRTLKATQLATSKTKIPKTS